MATGVIVHPEGIEDAPTEQSMTDGMALSFVNEEDCGFFGKSLSQDPRPVRTHLITLV
jgi:hypothetical protein